MTTNAPTSADACLSIVHSLMCHRQVCKNSHIFRLFKKPFFGERFDEKLTDFG